VLVVLRSEHAAGDSQASATVHASTDRARPSHGALALTEPQQARTCALVRFCMYDSRPQSALHPNLLKDANSNGASHVPSPQMGSTHTVCAGQHHRKQAEHVRQ
jgi:hypothetical protein